MSEASKKSQNAWHIAADWVEAFAPVIWDELDQQLRSAALTERARLDTLLEAGQALERPQVVLVDDVPVYGRELDGGKVRRDAGFFLCVVAEVDWSVPDDAFTVPNSTARLRLVRAFPKSNTEAWRLVFDELGYSPDFIVADAGTGIAAAIDAHFDPARTRFIPSIWHVSNAVETALAKVPAAFAATPAGKRLIDPLDKHQRELHRSSGLSSTAAWSTWWDDLDDILKANRLPVEKVRTRRAAYEPAFSAVLPDLLANPGVPISTGGLETLIAKHVHPMLAMRRSAFGNLERTNLLFDLAVARHHDVFDDHAHLIKLLRSDGDEHGGWTVPLRSIADPRPVGGHYSSLRDPTLLHTIADERGLV